MDGQADRTKLTVTFCNIIHVLKKGKYSNMVATVNNKSTTRKQLSQIYKSVYRIVYQHKQ